MGTHYTVTVPLSWDESTVDQPKCVAMVEFVDAHSGRRHEAQLGIDLERPAVTSRDRASP